MPALASDRSVPLRIAGPSRYFVALSRSQEISGLAGSSVGAGLSQVYAAKAACVAASGW